MFLSLGQAKCSIALIFPIFQEWQKFAQQPLVKGKIVEFAHKHINTCVNLLDIALISNHAKRVTRIKCHISGKGFCLIQGFFTMYLDVSVD